VALLVLRDCKTILKCLQEKWIWQAKKMGGDWGKMIVEEFETDYTLHTVLIVILLLIELTYDIYQSKRTTQEE